MFNTIDICHFLRDRIQIIAKFHSVKGREIVWCKRRNLENSSVFVNEDLPAQRQYNTLNIISREDTKMNCYKDKVLLNRNKLTIRNKIYTVDNLCTLPENIHPKTLSIKSIESTLCFGGRLSSHIPLSNSYKCNITFMNISVSSSKQALQYCKALHFHDDESAGA